MKSNYNEKEYETELEILQKDSHDPKDSQKINIWRAKCGEEKCQVYISAYLLLFQCRYKP